MITIIDDKIKYLSQDSYDNFIDRINIHQLSCTCDKKGNLIKHGWYFRSVKTPNGLVRLKILRVFCKLCKKTHAIVPAEIVPCSQTQLCDHVKIIKAYHSKESYEPIMENNQSVDESNIRYIVRKYVRYWKERLASVKSSVFDEIADLVTQCLLKFDRQFMQIKSTANILFVKPT